MQLVLNITAQFIIIMNVIFTFNMNICSGLFHGRFSNAWGLDESVVPKLFNIIVVHSAQEYSFFMYMQGKQIVCQFELVYMKPIFNVLTA